MAEVPVGETPDCHSTSVDNRYLYMACCGTSRGGLHVLDQQSLTIVKVVDTGPVYGTNVLPDGTTMLLHDHYGGIIILKDIQDMERIHVHKRLGILGTHTYADTLGGKGHLIGGGRTYLAAGWHHNNLYAIDLEDDYAWEVFAAGDPLLCNADDLVVSHDRTRAYTACYHNHDESYLGVIDLAARKVVGCVGTGRGTCGLTMSNDERYVIGSNDGDDSISVVDTVTEQVVATPCARAGFERLGIRGYIQGISVGQGDEVFVYGCSGNGALVRFRDVAGKGEWTVSYRGGKASSSDCG